MTIWVDADSCPRPVREIVQRAALRTGVEAVFVANRAVPGAEGEGVTFVRVGRSAGAADEYIVENSEAEDLIVTRDVPLARRLVDRGATVLNDRGDVFSEENVGERLSVRDFMYELRSRGLVLPSGRSFGRRETQAFANAFDRELTRLLRSES